MSAGDRIYQDITRSSFVEKAGEILADWKRGNVMDDEALRELAYEYEDKVDDLPEAEDDDD